MSIISIIENAEAKQALANAAQAADDVVRLADAKQKNEQRSASAWKAHSVIQRIVDQLLKANSAVLRAKGYDLRHVFIQNKAFQPQNASCPITHGSLFFKKGELVHRLGDFITPFIDGDRLDFIADTDVGNLKVSTNHKVYFDGPIESLNDRQADDIFEAFVGDCLK